MSELVFQTEWFQVRKEDSPYYKDPYYIIDFPVGIIILALTPDNKVILVQQYRPPVHSITLELPAGMQDKGETPLETAIRELYEETGYRCTDWKHLASGTLYQSRIGTEEQVYVGTGAVLDPNFVSKEPITTVLVNFTKAKDLFGVSVTNFVYYAVLSLAEDRLNLGEN